MAKTKKAKLPKQIAGMKIPKDLRKKGGALLEKANSPAGREVIAGALTMAAAAATAAVQRQRATRQAAAAKAEAEPRPGQPGIADPQALADAIGNAAEAVLTKLFGTKRPG